MSDLNKLLVHVPSSLCDDFRAKYIDGANRDKSYDSKVVFLEDTKEIFTKGKIYDANISYLVGTLPEGATSTNIVDYINEKINNADHKIIGNNNNSYKGFLPNAVNVDNSSYTLWAVKAYADYVGENIEKNIPEIYGGTGINVVSAIVDGKKHYRISTSAKVFYYKGNKPELINLPSTGNTIGDVWSVGPAKSKGSTLYAWDGDEWINLGSASGVSGVNTTVSSYGIGLTNSYGIVGLKVTSGLVDSKSSYFITGSTAYTAIGAAKKECYEDVKDFIYNYTSSRSSINGTYVNVNIETSGLEVSYVWVKEENPLIEAIDKANSALQTVSVLGKELSKTNNELDTSYAANTLKSYFDTYNFYDKYGTARGLINNLGGNIKSKNGTYVNVQVKTSKGEVNSVQIFENSYLIQAVPNANSALQTVTILDKTLSKNDNTLYTSYAAEKLISYFDEWNIYDKYGTAQGLINNLRGSYTSKNYSYLDVEVTSYQGEVSYVGVYEKNNILSNAINNANSAIQHVGTSGSPYLTYDLKDNGRTVTLKFDMNEVFSYIIKNLTFDSLSTTFKNQMLSYVVSNWVGYTGEVGILRD